MVREEHEGEEAEDSHDERPSEHTGTLLRYGPLFDAAKGGRRKRQSEMPLEGRKEVREGGKGMEEKGGISNTTTTVLLMLSLPIWRGSVGEGEGSLRLALGRKDFLFPRCPSSQLTLILIHRATGGEEDCAWGAC
jgi:hypothetical protein